MVASSGGKFQNDFILLYLLYKITLKKEIEWRNTNWNYRFEGLLKLISLLGSFQHVAKTSYLFALGNNHKKATFYSHLFNYKEIIFHSSISNLPEIDSWT